MSMYDFAQWDIVEADVPYRENINKSSMRPVLIVSETEVLVLKMTTHHRSEKPKPYEYEVMKWEQAGLTARTYVQCDYFIRLSEERFTGKKYGRLQVTDVIGVKQMMAYHGLSK